jgi:hypothetical protein
LKYGKTEIKYRFGKAEKIPSFRALPAEADEAY